MKTYKQILDRYCETRSIKGITLDESIKTDEDYARVIAQLLAIELFPEELEPFHD